METNTPRRTAEAADAGIDLPELLRKLWDGRRLILKGCLIGALAGLVLCGVSYEKARLPWGRAGGQACRG